MKFHKKDEFLFAAGRYSLILLLALCVTLVNAAEKPSCAVLSFDARQGIQASEAEALQSRFTALLNQNRSFMIIPPTQVKSTLQARDFSSANYPSSLTAAQAAGQLLGAEYVFSGQVLKEGAEYKFDVFLTDIASRKIVTSVRIRSTGEFDTFAGAAPEAALRHFLVAAESKAGETASTVSASLAAQHGTGRPSLRDIPPPSSTYQKSEAPRGRLRDTLAAEAESAPATSPRKTFFIGDTQFEIGTRLMVFRLNKTRKDSFFGSIDHLKALQDYLPNRLFVNWMFDAHHGVECSWDDISAKTLTTESGHSDGTIRVHGPIFTLFRRQPMTLHFPNSDLSIEPYVGAGIAIYKARFQHEAWYYHGFSGDTWQEAEANYNAWVDAGAAPWPNGGYRRIFTLNDPFGLVLNAGCSFTLTDHLSVDTHIRYTHLNVSGRYELGHYDDFNPPRLYTFPLSHIAFGVGIKYTF